MAQPSHVAEYEEGNFDFKLGDKESLIEDVLRLQNTLDDLSHRVAVVLKENSELRSYNETMFLSLEQLKTASSVFGSVDERPRLESKATKKR